MAVIAVTNCLLWKPKESGHAFTAGVVWKDNFCDGYHSDKAGCMRRVSSSMGGMIRSRFAGMETGYERE
jgi:hypothetical protein